MSLSNLLCRPRLEHEKQTTKRVKRALWDCHFCSVRELSVKQRRAARWFIQHITQLRRTMYFLLSFSDKLSFSYWKTATVYLRTLIPFSFSNLNPSFHNINIHSFPTCNNKRTLICWFPSKFLPYRMLVNNETEKTPNHHSYLRTKSSVHRRPYYIVDDDLWPTRDNTPWRGRTLQVRQPRHSHTSAYAARVCHSLYADEQLSFSSPVPHLVLSTMLNLSCTLARVPYGIRSRIPPPPPPSP